LCSSRQPYNAREFSNLWVGIGAPTRSAPCAAAQAAHPWSRPCYRWSTHFTVHRYTCTRVLSLH
jgi:hypothetical protein